MEGQKQHLYCPVCGRRVLITITVSKDHPAAKSAVCSNEYTAHVGFILYKFIDVSELHQQAHEELTLN